MEQHFLFASWFFILMVLVAIMVFLLIQHCNYENHQTVLALEDTNNVSINSTYQDDENDGFEMVSL